MAYAIHTDGLTRRFGGRTAVDQVTFTVEVGEVFGLLGPNGAGKTTLVRLLNGILAASAGEAQVLGYNPRSQGEAMRRHTGVLTETPALYERLTARDNLRFFGTLYEVPEPELEQRVDELLEQFDLRARANERVGTFSKGMKQRLALARTLIHRPQILFFDEPTSGLDPEAAREVNGLIAELSRKDERTVFLCTHNLDEAQRLCDRVGIINQGRLLAVGTPASLAHDLWQGQWVEIRLQTPPEAPLPQSLQAIKGVIKVTIDGVYLAAQVSSEDAVPDVVAAVVKAGGRILRVEPREHSLQEIYFKLQEEARS